MCFYYWMKQRIKKEEILAAYEFQKNSYYIIEWKELIYFDEVEENLNKRKKNKNQNEAFLSIYQKKF